MSAALFGCNFGPLTNGAALALLVAASIRIGLQFFAAGAERFSQPVLGVAGVAAAAALGFVCFVTFLSDVPDGVRMAAVISTVGYVLLAAERDAQPPVYVDLQAVFAFGMAGAGLSLNWSAHTPAALSAVLSVAVALGVAARRRTRRLIKLRDAERRFSAAFNGMSQCIGIFDGGSRLLWGNSQFMRMFRISGVDGMDSVVDALLRKKLGVRLKSPLFLEKLCEAAQMASMRQNRHSAVVDLADDRSMEFVFQSTAEGFSMLIEDITARRASEARVERMARKDDLTGLSNRSTFRVELESATARIVDSSAAFAVMLIDLDRFKHVNDTLGHAVGDRLLQRVAKRMQEMAAEGDMVARLGGDEFVFLRHCGRTEAAEFAMRAVETLSEPYHVDGAKLTIGASIGIAMAPDDGLDDSELMKSADMALYAAKDAGRGAFRFFEKSMAEMALRKQEIESDLRIGIGRNELEVHYQPIVSLARRRICGCEALVRWRHPTLGMISPGEFMEVAEESGLVVQLGEAVLRQACLDAKSWPREVRLAVNFSAVQFSRGNVSETVKRVLKETKFPPARLEMEITESVLMNDAESALAIIDELRELGISVALDDFGTGYSSLAYLSRFRPNKVKIDQSFVRDMDKNGTSLAIIKAVKAIVQELGIELLAEGVETMQQFEILRANGADEAQGYLFSKPRPAHEIARLIADPTQLVRGRKLIADSSSPWVNVFERVNPSAASNVN